MGNIADFLGDCKCNKNISEIEEMEEIRFSKTKKYTKKEEASRTKSRRDILNQTNETIKEEEAKNKNEKQDDNKHENKQDNKHDKHDKQSKQSNDNSTLYDSDLNRTYILNSKLSNIYIT